MSPETEDSAELPRRALSDALAASMDAAPPEGTARSVHRTIRFEGKATAIVGMRRAGKTMFVHQLRREHLARGAPRTHVPYINFEDERLVGMDAKHLGFILDEFGRRVPGSRSLGSVLWSFDEIQLIPGWERFIRRLLDSAAAEVVITGSSAALLSREIATAMRGRAWEIPLFPFGFEEALRHRGIAVPERPELLGGSDRSELEGSFLEWLTAGGFPEVQGLEVAARRQLLRDYVDVVMLRDVVERHGVSNVQGLRWLVRHLLANAAGAFSIEKFHGAMKSQGIAIARDTLHELLAHLEDCFLVRTIWLETDSERRRMVNPRKVYPVDPGLIPLYDRTGRANRGHALETAVLIELQRRRCEVTYVRTAGGFEVDFLARDPDGSAHLIQVCADASAPSVAHRELRALEEARIENEHARAWLLTATRDGSPPERPDRVEVLPAYEWMLAGSPAG